MNRTKIGIVGTEKIEGKWHFVVDIAEVNSLPELEEFTSMIWRSVVLSSDGKEQPKTWTVKKRYSEFHALEQKIKKANKGAGVKKDSLFPPKLLSNKFSANQSEKAAADRQSRLDAWLKDLVDSVEDGSQPGLAPLVAEFLHSEALVEASSERGSVQFPSSGAFLPSEEDEVTEKRAIAAKRLHQNEALLSLIENRKTELETELNKLQKAEDRVNQEMHDLKEGGHYFSLAGVCHKARRWKDLQIPTKDGRRSSYEPPAL